MPPLWYAGAFDYGRTKSVQFVDNFWDIANLFASQASYDASPSAGKTMASTAVLQTLGWANAVATTNPPGTVTLRDGTLGYGAHNLLTYSETPSGWPKENVSWNASTFKLVEAAGSNVHRLNSDASTYETGQHFCVYADVKAGERNWFFLNASSAFAASATFDVSAGVVGTISAGTAGIVALGGGVYRCWVAGVGTGTSSRIVYPEICTGTNGPATETYVGDGTSGLYLYRLQLNRGPVALDYVPTTTAAVYAPRFTHDKTNSTYFGLYGVYPQAGLLREVGRTNLALWCRDLTNAAWAASSVTVAKTATGIDGVANSASTLTASGANGTVLQAITSGSAERITSAFVRRKTGTGVINMTQDNGTTWTAISVQPYWSQIPIPKATAANPTIGFRIVTSGDAIEVDYVQHEVGGFVTSPILTTTAAVTRDADLIRPPTTYINDVAQTTVVGIVPAAVTTLPQTLIGRSGHFSADVGYLNSFGAIQMYDSTNNPTGGGAALSAGVPALFATRYSAGGMGISVNGQALGTSAFDGTMGGGVATVEIGSDGTGNYGFTGLITRISIATRAANDADLQAASAGLK